MNKNKVVPFILLFVLCLNFVFVTVPTANASSWLVSSWDSCMKLTIDSGDINGDLTNFPVLVYLDDTRVDWELIQDDLDDLRFTVDNATLLSYEIDDYTINDEAYIWVNIPMVDDTVDTEFFMYYDNVLVSSGEDAENVWNINYMMVQHLKDTTVSTVSDSTSNNNDGIKEDDNEPIETINGKIDNAQNFDGDDDYITVSNDPTLNFNDTTDFTLSAWYKNADGSDYNYLLFKGDIKVGEVNYFIRTQITTGRFYAVIDGAIGNTAVEGLINVCDGNWHKLDAVFDRSGDLTLYTDGVVDGTPLDISGVGNVDNTIELRISSRLNNGVWAYFSIGIIDEARVINNALSSSWVFASYETQRDHLLTYGSLIQLEIVTMALEISILAFIFGIVALTLVFTIKK